MIQVRFLAALTLVFCCSSLEVDWGDEALNNIQREHEKLMALIASQINVDDGLPSPTSRMQKRKDYLMERQVTDADQLETIIDISQTQEMFLERSQEGWNALYRLKNFSLAVQDTNDTNFMFASRVIRYNDNVLKTEEFRMGMGYIGVLFQALKITNYDVKLVPEVNELVDTLDFRKERFFDIQELIDILDSIDSVSQRTADEFEYIYGFVYLNGCKRKIRARQLIIQKAAGNLKQYVLALNFSRAPKDPVVQEYFDKFRRSCGGNRCYNAMRYLMGHMKQDKDYKTSEACDFVDLTKESNERHKVYIYPCYRDFMIQKSASIMQSVMQGILVISVFKQPMTTRQAEPNNFLGSVSGFYEVYCDAVDRVKYNADKCKYKDQGEVIAKAQFEVYMNDLMQKTDKELKKITGSSKYASRKEDIEKALFKFLSRYHSDQRWIVKSYPYDAKKEFFTHDFTTSTFFYKNVYDPFSKASLTVLIYNKDAHEYFYGRYNEEPVHEFCHIIGT